MISTRTVPMEVLSLSVSRTGSASICAALGILGYANPYHGYKTVASPTDQKVFMEIVDRKFGAQHARSARKLTRSDFDKVLGNSAAATDMQIACFWPEMMEAYPVVRTCISSEASTFRSR